MRSKNSTRITQAELAPRRGWYERRFEPRPTAVHCRCEHCGADIWLPKSKVEMYRTCGGECASARKRAPVRARTRSCATCGETFVPRSTQVRIGRGRFCSQKCNAAAHEAMNTNEAHLRAAAGWKRTLAQRDFVARGPKNGKWKGGRKATYERMKARGLIRDYNSRRRAFRRKGLPNGTIPMLERKQRMMCANCRKSLRSGYHLDHIFPISKGGEHEPENVQLLCPPCNIRKHNKLPHEWAKANGRLL